MKKKKLLNDPVYGFVTIPHELLLELIDHPLFQRLRRIKQVGLTDYVFPGASHSRFHHALGALHLMNMAINTLRSKGIDINEEEALGVSVAILLHDIGHAPFSHILEHTLIRVRHEFISLEIMKYLNREFDGALDKAIHIFANKYEKGFLHQLISSQLDMDRLDYLNRDSFYTGVAEGVVGYDRIIKLLNVYGNQLVIEEKGFFSVEKYLISRHFMYWQVYLHKAVISAEQMLVQIIRRVKTLMETGQPVAIPDPLTFFLEKSIRSVDFSHTSEDIIEQFGRLDDSDILYLLKANTGHDDPVLSYLCRSLLNRRLFKIHLSEKPLEEAIVKNLHQLVQERFGIDENEATYFVVQDLEQNAIYDQKLSEILVLSEDGQTIPMSNFAQNLRLDKKAKHFICFPGEVRSEFRDFLIK